MMKSLPVISKKGVILISAGIMIIAGALVVALPSSSEGCRGGDCKGGHHGHNSDTSYVNVPILNNTGKKITITKMDITVPGECYESGGGCGGGGGGGGSHWENEVRVKDIYFGGTGGPTGTNVFSTDYTNCCCKKCGGYTHESGFDAYDFTGAKILCTFSLDVNPAPSGEYTVTYHFTIEGVAGLKSNTITFSL